MMTHREPHPSAETKPLPSETILPSQWLPEFPQRLLPEKRLLIAIVDDSVNCFLRYRFATDARGRQLFREAEKWIMCTDRNSPFGFESICDVLGLDAAYLRNGLRQWHARDSGIAAGVETRRPVI